MDKRKQPHSIEHRRKIGEAQKGIPKPSVRGELNGAKNPEARLKISLALKGKKKSPEHIAKIKLVNIGRKTSDATKLKQSIIQKTRVANGTHHLWKGGLTKLHKSERKFIEGTLEYRLWRKSVFERDNYTCRFCGKRGGVIHADHIKPFCDYPELRLAIDNGRTLCVECHRKTDTYGSHKPT